MFDLPSHRPAAHGAAYSGPERRATNTPFWRWLAATLDEIDYGLLLLDDHAQVLHINRTARDELDADHPLQLLGPELRARHPRDVAPLHAALDGAVRRGLRKLLTLGEDAAAVGISVVPLGTFGQNGRSATLVMLGKRRVVGELAVQAFARAHGLTPGETRVLVALCDGLRPARAAALHGVAISTVRSQIGSIRVKTGAASIRDLLHKVAALPPLMGVLRQTTPRGHEAAGELAAGAFARAVFAPAGVALAA